LSAAWWRACLTAVGRVFLFIYKWVMVKAFPVWLEHKKRKPGQAFCLKGNAVYYHSALRVMIDSVFLFGVSRFTRWAYFFAYEFI
jgi:hypothetical protein